MSHAWLVSIISSATFLLTAVFVVTSAPMQESAGQTSRPVGPQQIDGHAAEGLMRSPDTHNAISNNAIVKNLNRLNPNASTPNASNGAASSSLAQATTGYQPREEVFLADPSNYGERYKSDPSGQPLSNDYIVVLHETVGSASSAINTFQTHHPNDNDQVSYHSLIALDGTVIYVVSPEQRAFGAGNSAFQTSSGEVETVFTNPDFPSSVNNFAYHISLETPPDGQNSNATTHSGYTEAQYQSLAWLLARTTVPNDRITTHRQVDRSGSRIDPRSFEADRLLALLNQYSSRR